MAETKSRPSPKPNFPFLAGGGEMGILMRKKDWENTPVGNPKAWPQSLRTAISILLHSKFPMFLFWGPGLICFYNDAYRPSLGNNGKHPFILGEPAAEAWQEIWKIIKPLIDQVLGGGEATWSEDQLIPIYRNGSIEDVYWTFSYSAVNDETGTPAGVLVTCTETTEKVKNLLLLQETKNQLHFAIEAAALATWDYNPVTNKFTANARLKEWFGFDNEAEIDLSDAINAIAAPDRKRVTDAIEKALDFSSGGNYDIEYTVINAVTHNGIIVHAKGRAWFDEEKKAYRMTGTLADITKQARSRKKMEISEQRFQAAVNAIEGTLWTNNPLGEMEGEQPGWAALTGQTIDEYKGFGWVKALHPDDAQPTLAAWKEAVAERNTFIFEHRLKVTDGSWGYFSIRAIPVLNEDDSIKEWVGVHTNITKQKKGEILILESEEKFRILADNIPNLAWMANADGWIYWYNKKWYDYTGTTPEQMEGWGWQSVHDPKELPAVLDRWKEVIASGESFKMVFPLKGADGKFRQFLTLVSPLKNRGGEITQWFGTNTDITEQKEAENELKEGEERFRTMAENTNVLIAVGDETGNGTYFNKAWVELTGRPMEDLLKFGWVDLLHPEDRQGFVDIYLTAFKKRETFSSEFRVLSKEGDYRWLLAKGPPRFLPNGSFAGYISSCIDITEIKKTEAILKDTLLKEIGTRLIIEENKERLELIINASELGIWEINIKTLEIISSPRFLEIIGFPELKKITVDETRELVVPEDLPLRDEAFKKAFETGQLHYTGRIMWRDKSIHWIETKGKIYYDEGNKPVKIIGTLADITEEKEQQQILHDSEQKFRLLADSMPQFVWTGDAGGNLNYFNEAVYNYSGLTAGQIHTGGWLQIVHPDDRDENIKAWLHSVSTGQDFLFEHRFRRHDGEYQWQLSRAVAKKNAAGNVQMWVGTSTNIHEIKEQDEQKDFFINMAGHELKTPLTTIKGYVEMLQIYHQNHEDNILTTSLATINKQVKAVNRLISEMLDISKIKQGRLSYNKEDFEINEMVNEVINEIRLIKPGQEITFSKQTDEMVYADRERIAEVMINFLNNAIKYSPGSTLVKVESIIKDDQVIISVQDFGIGISEKDKDRVFEKFYRVEGKNEKRFAGFGIGLFVSAEIIQGHSGKIGVSSEPGKGSIFYFSLPINKK